MASARSYQCLSCRLNAVKLDAVTTVSRRSFATTPTNQARKRRARPTIQRLIEDATRPARQAEAKGLAEHLRPYTDREKKLLAMKYTPEQMKAIEEGEKAVDTDDLATQGRFRTDKLRLDYIDDLATLRPLVDTLSAGAGKAEARGDELVEGKQPATESMHKLAKDRKPAKREEEEEEDPRMLRLMQQTGLTKEQIRKLRVKNLVNHRVVNQTRMGKIQSLYFLTIAGNQDGMLGIGEGKAAEDEDGRRQAMMNAIRNMKPIARYEDRTIHGDVEAKVGASVVQLMARPPGFGNRCQHLIFELARAAGINDLAARTPRSRNKMNVVKAAFQALTNQRLPEDVARARGRKMVDVRGVYYGGIVH